MQLFREINSKCMTLVRLWGYSSVGRALAWHARGQQFDSAYLHQRFAVEVEEENLVKFKLVGWTEPTPEVPRF